MGLGFPGRLEPGHSKAFCFFPKPLQNSLRFRAVDVEYADFPVGLFLDGVRDKAFPGVLLLS